MVPAGSVLTFDVQGAVNGYTVLDDTGLRNNVINGLTPHFDVPDFQLTRDSFYGGQLFDWKYSAVVTVTTRADYGAIRDIGSIIANAFYNIAGAIPTVSSQDAGQAQGPAITETGMIDVGTEIGDLLGGATKPLTDLFTQTEWLVIGGIVLIVALIVFSPAGREGARSIGRIRAV